MRRVVWSKRASADYQRAISYIAEDSAFAAAKVARRIDDATVALGRYPSGRPGRLTGWYEKSLTDINYIVAYSLDDPPGVLNILRIVHTSREWLPGTWPD